MALINKLIIFLYNNFICYLMNIVRIRINNKQYLILTLNEEIYVCNTNDFITPWSMILWNFATIEFALALLFYKVYL